MPEKTGVNMRRKVSIVRCSHMPRRLRSIVQRRGLCFGRERPATATSLQRRRPSRRLLPTGSRYPTRRTTPACSGCRRRFRRRSGHIGRQEAPGGADVTADVWAVGSGEVSFFGFSRAGKSLTRGGGVFRSVQGYDRVNRLRRSEINQPSDHHDDNQAWDHRPAPDLVAPLGMAASAAAPGATTAAPT